MTWFVNLKFLKDEIKKRRDIIFVLINNLKQEQKTKNVKFIISSGLGRSTKYYLFNLFNIVF